MNRIYIAVFSLFTGCSGVLGYPDSFETDSPDYYKNEKPAENACLGTQCGPGEECLPHNESYPTMCCFPMYAIDCPRGEYHVLYDCKEHGYILWECWK